MKFEFTASGMGRCNPSTYIYDCHVDVIQFAVVFDTSTYVTATASMSFQEDEGEPLELGRLGHWRFMDMQVESVLLRVDERILLDDPAE
ncbi:MAG: hypothetical protein R3F27_07925 [Gammaproteobacteria bacterium]